MKHTHYQTNNATDLDFDGRLASSSIPTEECNEIRIASQGIAHTDLALTHANQTEPSRTQAEHQGRDESLLRQPLTAVGEQFALATTPVRRQRAPRRSRNHELLGLLKEFQSDPYTDFIVMTRSAIESGMRCTRWKNMGLLNDALPDLADIADQVEDIDDAENAERIELAMRKHDNCRSLTSWGKTIALPHQYDVNDVTLDVSLRIHFATDLESCRIIVGWIEEICHGDASGIIENQHTDAGHNALACA